MAKVTHRYFEAIGRRRTSTARVRLYPLSKGKEITVATIKVKAGDIFVNSKPVSTVFGRPGERVRLNQPLELTKSKEKFGVTIVVKGGGKNGQLEAIVHGISRAIEKVDKESFRGLLKKEGLLKRDPRKRERRKVGTGGKARRQKQSPKR